MQPRNSWMKDLLQHKVINILSSSFVSIAICSSAQAQIVTNFNTNPQAKAKLALQNTTDIHHADQRVVTANAFTHQDKKPVKHKHQANKTLKKEHLGNKTVSGNTAPAVVTQANVPPVTVHHVRPHTVNVHNQVKRQSDPAYAVKNAKSSKQVKASTIMFNGKPVKIMKERHEWFGSFDKLKKGTGLSTMPKVVRFTVLTNPLILQTDAQAKEARESIETARAGYLPQANILLGIGRDTNANSNTNFTETTLTRKQVEVSASQLIWDGWGTIYKIQSTAEQYKASVFQVAEQRELTGLRATEVYLDVLRYAMLTDVSLTDVKAHKETVRKVRIRYQGGAGQKADTDLAESRLAQSTSELLASEGLLKDANFSFVHVVGVIPYQLQMPMVPKLPTSLSQALRLAFANSPALKVARKNIQVACANMRVARATFSPRFSLESGYIRDRDMGGVPGKSDETDVMVMMRYNIINGGADVATLRQAVYKVYEAKRAYSEAKRTVRENVTASWNNYNIAGLRVVQLQQRVTSTAEVLVAYQKQFELGQRSLLNLVDTERELFNSRSDLINARFLVYSSAYRLFASMGLLTKVMS